MWGPLSEASYDDYDLTATKSALNEIVYLPTLQSCHKHWPRLVRVTPSIFDKLISKTRVADGYLLVVVDPETCFVHHCFYNEPFSPLTLPASPC